MSGTLTEFVQIVGMCDIEDIDLTQGNFTQIAVPETLEIPEQKPDVEQVLKVMVEGEITSVRLVATPEGEASSGMKKTGKGLVVEGKLHQKIVYVAETDKGDQPVHSAEFNIPFSTFIAINTCLEAGEEDEIDVEICIEDVYVEMLNQREVFKNITLVVNAIVPETDPTVEIVEPQATTQGPPPSVTFADDLVIPIKVEAFDCECLDRVELVITNNADVPIFEETELAMGDTDLIATFNWDTTPAVPAGGPFTVTATVYDCAGNTATDTLQIVLN